MIESRKAIFSLACLFGVVAMMLLPSGCGLLLGGGTGTLQVLITDAPFPFSLVTEASVTITRIEVRQDSSTAGDTAVAEDDSDDGDGDDDNENADDDDGDTDNGDDDNDNANGDEDNENDNGNSSGYENENENGNGNDNSDDDGEDDEDDDADDDADEAETAETGEGNSGGGGSAFLTILDEEVTVNLLDLQNGVTAPLASTSLTAGSYSQIRFIVSSGRVVLTDGREFELTVPSGAQTGIKLSFDFAITGDETTTLLLDMDVSKAFVPIPGGDVNDASQIQSFLFKPSLALRITELESTGTASGAVVDESDAPLAGVAVTAFLGDVEVTTSSTAKDGSYVLSGLEPGTYSVACSLPGFTEQTVPDVKVTAGANTVVDPVVLAAETP